MTKDDTGDQRKPLAEPGEIRDLCTTLIRESEGWPRSMRAAIPVSLESVLVFPETAAKLLGPDGASERFRYMQAITRGISSKNLTGNHTRGKTPPGYVMLFTVTDTYIRSLQGDEELHAVSCETAHRNVALQLAHLGMPLDPEHEGHRREVVGTAHLAWVRYREYYRTYVQALGDENTVVPQTLTPYRRAVELREQLEELAEHAGALPLTVLRPVCEALRGLFDVDDDDG